jgi:hypothetical protein
MKKIMYAILTCIIIAGIVVIATIGLKADIIYSKNVEIDVYIGKTFEKNDIKDIAKSVFGDNRIIIQEIELFEDMVSIKIPDTLSEDELNSKVEELNNKINEKYSIENSVEDIEITHNPKIKLSSIIMPYVYSIAISMIIILIFVAIRYKKLGVVKTIITYILSILATELTLLSIIAITRFPINRMVIPIGLLVLVVVLTILGFLNEKKLSQFELEAKNKKASKSI